MCIVGLVFISIGIGGIQPCISALCGDHFVLPQQEPQLENFFLTFLFFEQFAILIPSIFLVFLCDEAEIIGWDGYSDCSPGLSGALSVVIIIGSIIFLLGRPLYTFISPSRNMFCRSLHCISVNSSIL